MYALVCVFGRVGGGTEMPQNPLQAAVPHAVPVQQLWLPCEAPRRNTGGHASVCARAWAVTAISSHNTIVVRNSSCLWAMVGADIHYPGRPQAKLRCVSQTAAELPLDTT